MNFNEVSCIPVDPSSVVNNIRKIYNPDVVKSVVYGKYRTAGTFDVRRQNAINIYIYIYIYIYSKNALTITTSVKCD